MGGSTESFAELGLGFWQLTGANANFSELGLGWGLFFSNQVCTSAPKVMDIPRFIPLRTQFVWSADGHMLESSKGISLQTCNLRSRRILPGRPVAGPRRLPKGYAPTERQISHVHLQEGYHTVPMGCGGAALALCSTLRPPGLCYSTQLGPC